MTAVRFLCPDEIQRLRGSLTDRHASTGALADAARLNTLSMIAYAGSGHIGTSFSNMDIIAWLWTQELRDPLPQARGEGDLYFSSKGHDVPGLYALLICLGKLDASGLTKLRRLDGLPGHPDVHTPYMVTNTGSLGMGISKARGMVLANRLDGKSGRVFVVTGDGELQEGQFWESLQPTANGAFSEITVIVDHNRMQSDTFVADVSPLGDLRVKVGAFGWAVDVCDGHDTRDIEAALARLAASGPRPRLLIANTIKGRGVSFMESDAVGPDRLYRFHSGAPSWDQYTAGLNELLARLNSVMADAGQAPLRTHDVAPPVRVSVARPQNLITAYADELVRLGHERPDLVVLDADLMVDCGTLGFKRAFPDRFVECGIAEQDMVSMAGALALKGKLPIVHSFASFLSTRPNEHIYNNATEGSRIVYHASLAGLLPAGPGHSHQCVRDISTMGSVPGLTLIQPADELETRLALRWAALENAGSTYLRLTSIPRDVPYRMPDDHTLIAGRGTVLCEGRDAVVIAYGPVMLSEAFRAVQLLETQGRSLTLVNLPWLNRVDAAWLADLLHGHRTLFLIEDHYTELGQNAFITRALCMRGMAIRTLVLGVDGIPRCGQADEILEHHGLSAGHLARRIGAAL